LAIHHGIPSIPSSVMSAIVAPTKMRITKTMFAATNTAASSFALEKKNPHV
jgi:hypothetical protein